MPFLCHIVPVSPGLADSVESVGYVISSDWASAESRACVVKLRANAGSRQRRLYIQYIGVCVVDALFVPKCHTTSLSTVQPIVHAMWLWLVGSHHEKEQLLMTH